MIHFFTTFNEIAYPNPSTGISIITPSSLLCVNTSFELFIPISLPDALNNQPPEFPGFISALVCISFFVILDTTPVVRVLKFSKPKGHPIAITV